MKISLAPMTLDDGEQIIDIFNYYVENAFAAYIDQKVPYEFFEMMLHMCKGHPTVTAKDEEGTVVGFGTLRPYNPIPSFRQTAEITYFVKPHYTGKGIGTSILEYLIEQGKNRNLTTVLASVSSFNTGSISFHLKNGFAECGRFRDVGRKKGKAFDVVYFQKMI